MLERLLRRKRSTEARTNDDGELFDDEFQRRLEVLAIVSRKIYAGRMRAERRSKKTGSGIEFADHREYVPGDDFRYLDWNVYQRTGKLLVRLFEEEEDLSVYVLLDTSRSMGLGSPPKLRYGKQLAAALGFVALANLDRVSVQTFSDSMRARLAPTRGKNRIFKLFEFLRPMVADGKTSMQDALKTFVAQNKRRGIVILISDLYDPQGFEDGINILRYGKFEVYALHLIDSSELKPHLHGDVRLLDTETGEYRDITATPKILERYASAVTSYRKRIEDFCRDKQVTYQSLDTSVPFDEAVLQVLRRGTVLG